MTAMDTRTRWLALIVLCLGTLMIVLDTTIVNVALPSISGSSRLDALVGGYHVAFAVGALFAAGAAVLGATLLRVGQQSAAEAPTGAPAEACS